MKKIIKENTISISMQLEHNFYGIVTAELYYPHIRERVIQDLLVQRLHKVLLIYQNDDFKWRAEYLPEEDVWAITNNWCKTSDCWGITDGTQYAQRIKILKIDEEYQFNRRIENMID